MHRFAQAGLEGFARSPAKFALDFGTIDGVAQIMAGTVGNIGDERAMGADIGVGRELVHQVANGVNHVNIAAFIDPADIIAFAEPALFHHQQQSLGVIIDEQPVANIRALAIDRQRVAFQGVEDHQRDQFFREMIWPVIIGAIGVDHRQAIGMMPGADEMVRAGF